MKAPIELFVGDIIELRKPHPCGGTIWRVLRVGLDVGIECSSCQRYVLVPRSRLESRLKRFVSHVTESDSCVEKEER